MRNLQCLFSNGTVLWCGTDTGLWRMDEDTQAVQETGLRSFSVLSMEWASGTHFPICGTSKGLQIFDGQEWRSEPVFGSREVRYLCRDVSGLWCGTNRGLWQYLDDAWQTVELGELPLNTSINCLYSTDKELWCGTEVGLAYFDGEHFEVVMPEINVLCLLRDVGGAIWCGTSVGLLRYSGEGSWVCQLQIRSRVQCLLQDPNATLLCGTPEGLWQFDGLDWKLIYSQFGSVACVAYHRQRVWCGGPGGLEPLVYGQPLADVTHEEEQVSTFKEPVPQPSSLDIIRISPLSQLEPVEIPSQLPQVINKWLFLKLLRKPALIVCTAVIVLFGLIYGLNLLLRPLDPLQTTSKFYQLLSEKGRLPDSLSTTRLQNSIGNETHHILKLDSLRETIQTQLAGSEDESTKIKLKITIVLKDNGAVEGVVTLLRARNEWRVDRIQHYEVRRRKCPGSERKEYVTFDTSWFEQGKQVGFTEYCLSRS